MHDRIFQEAPLQVWRFRRNRSGLQNSASVIFFCTLTVLPEDLHLQCRQATCLFFFSCPLFRTLLFFNFRFCIRRHFICCYIIFIIFSVLLYLLVSLFPGDFSCRWFLPVRSCRPSDVPSCTAFQWIFLPLYADPHGIASSQNIKNLLSVLNFSVFASHSISPFIMYCYTTISYPALASTSYGKFVGDFFNYHDSFFSGSYFF